MTRTKIQSGLVTYWSLVQFFDRQKLEHGWRLLGFGGHVPEQRSPLICLKDALTEVSADRGTLVRPLKSANGYAVVRETKGDDENEYATLFNARIPVGSDFPVFSTAGEVVDQVTESFLKHRRMATAAQVSGKLVNILYQMGGTRLRPSGGVYWLAGDSVEDWEVATAVMTDAGQGGPPAVYLIEHEMTPQAVVAVKDGLVTDIESRIKQLYDELASGDMGERGLKARQDNVIELKTKVAEYEQMLDVSLSELRGGLDELGQAVASATMVLMCGTTPSSDQQRMVDAH